MYEGLGKGFVAVCLLLGLGLVKLGATDHSDEGVAQMEIPVIDRHPPQRPDRVDGFDIEKVRGQAFRPNRQI